MPRIWITLTLVLLAGCSGSPEPQPNEAFSLTLKEPQKILVSGEWERRIWYQAQGTRSEGQHGVLLHAGKELPQKKVGEEIYTSLGLLKNYGAKPYGFPWAPSGWNFADQALIIPSWESESHNP